MNPPSGSPDDTPGVILLEASLKENYSEGFMMVPMMAHHGVP